MGAVRRMLAALFAGDPRVWRGAALLAVPSVLLIAFYCLQPRDYYTGTDNVEAYSYVVRTSAKQPLCIPGLRIPANTARIRLQLRSPSGLRPTIRIALAVEGSGKVRRASLAPVAVPAHHAGAAVFSLPALPSNPSVRRASLCLTAAGVVEWGGTQLRKVPASAPPTAGGQPLRARIAVWYLPPRGARRSYLAAAGPILRRAALFRPGFIGPWLYVLLLLFVLPLLGLASVRCLALSATASASDRRLLCWLFAIAALNFVCWALITPPFQAPDEVDHFAYTQSLVERGQAPSRNPASRLGRWSSAEALALDEMSFLTDHQVGDSRPPWNTTQEQHYRLQLARIRPRSDNGGGYETAATHGAIYYATLAPAYVLASDSPLDQLTLMRLTSALIGALTVVFAFQLTRELAPGRTWLAVLAALLVAYEPMYGFVSGSVNNDVGVNAGAAALELLLIMILRRGLTVRLGLITGALLLGLPVVKGTVYSLYPVVAIVLLATLRRQHRRADIPAWTAVAAGATAVGALSTGLSPALRQPAAPTPKAYGGTAFAANAVSGALAHPLDYLAYVWQVFLPRLSFMAPHFETTANPAFVIFVERGWGAFGWYDVLFPNWVYVVILAAMLLTPVLGIVAIRRELAFVRSNLFELLVLVLIPVAVLAGVEAAFYLSAPRTVIAEYGRYFFPVIAPLAVLVVASLHAFGRPRMIYAGAGLLGGMLALSYASQLLTLTTFYA